MKIREACFNINDHPPEPLLIRKFEARMTSLGDFLSSQNATLSELEQIDIFLKACNGLRYIHEKGIIHCSIGLQSIALMRDASGGFTVKLKDFRRARMERDSSVSERPLHPWVASDTSPFSEVAPPEARKCRTMHYTRKIDVYLLGVAMLEVIASRIEKTSWFYRLFKHDDPMDIAVKEKSDQPFMAIIIKCLEDELDKRATSANVYSELRQEEMRLSLNLALEGNTSITTSVIRILFIGPPEVGKSSLKHVLVNNEPKAIETSTAMMESPDFVRVTSDQCIVDTTSKSSSKKSNYWELMNDRAMITVIQDTVLAGKPTKENLPRRAYSLSTDTSVLRTTNQQPTSGSNLPTSAKYSPKVSCQNVMNEQYMQDSSFQEEGVSLSESTAQIEEFDNHGTLDMLNIALEEVRKTYDCDKPEFKLEDTQLIHILDTGGQPCFHDVLPVFLDVPCTYVLVFKASAAKKFDQKASITYRYKTNPESLSTDATQNYNCDDLEGHIPQSPNTDLGVEGAHASPKKLQSKSKDHQNIEMETNTPLFHDPTTDESPMKSSLSTERGLRTPGMGLESPEAQRFETIGSSCHSPEVGTESQHSQMKSPHSPDIGTESQHSQMKSPHTPEVGTESQHSQMKSPHTPEVGTESQHSQIKSPHSPEVGTESHRGLGLGTEQLQRSEIETKGQHGQGMELKGLYSPELETENQHRLGMETKSLHNPEMGTKGHCQLEMGTKSPHNLEIGTEGQHGLEMGTNSSHESDMKTESRRDQLTSPHRSKMGTENKLSLGKRTKSPDRCKTGQETEAQSPRNPEIGTDSQHRPPVHRVVRTHQTELQMLQRLCSTIQAMQLKNFGNLAKLCGIQHKPRPRICLIGTFKDEIPESSLPEARSKIEATFKECLESRDLSRSVIKDKENHFFLLNALGPMKDSQHAKYINNLRKSLSKSESAIKIRIPLMWYQLQEITVRVSPHFVKYRLLKSFAIENRFCSNSSNQSQSFRTFVRLFHLLGFYAYFDLPDTPDDHNWVCTDATIFYQQVSKLLAVQFIPDKDLKPTTKRFKKTGLLVHHTQAVDSESNEFVKDLYLDTAMDLGWFFSVLCHLGIAANLVQEQSQMQLLTTVFFIPAALPERDVSSSIHTLPPEVPHIYISLKLQESLGSKHHHTLPQGIFAQVAIKFLNTLEGCKPCKADNFRGSIKFRSDKYSALIQLTEFASYIEVAIQAQENSLEQLHKCCSQVRKLIKSITEDICVRQFPGIKNMSESKVIYGFPCHCENSKATVESHLAEVCDFEENNESAIKMVCIKEGMLEQYQPLCTEQRLWFTSAIEIEQSQVDLEKGHGKGDIKPFYVEEPIQASQDPIHKNPEQSGDHIMVTSPLPVPHKLQDPPVPDNPANVQLESVPGGPPVAGEQPQRIQATVQNNQYQVVEGAGIHSKPHKDPNKLTIKALMPYIGELASLGLQISGWLDMSNAWAAISKTPGSPVDHLQQLLMEWLNRDEDPDVPHTWEHFISVVRNCTKGKLAERMEREVFGKPHPSPSGPAKVHDPSTTVQGPHPSPSGPAEVHDPSTTVQGPHPSPSGPAEVHDPSTTVQDHTED